MTDQPNFNDAAIFLDGAVRTFIKQVPEPLRSHLQFKSTCEINDRERALFNFAFRAFSHEMELVPPIIGDMPVCCFMIDDENVSWYLGDPSIFGVCMYCVIYPLHRWRARTYTDANLIAAILEELCHCFYAISDELLVKERVAAIAGRHNPFLTPHTLYPWIFPEQ